MGVVYSIMCLFSYRFISVAILLRYIIDVVCICYILYLFIQVLFIQVLFIQILFIQILFLTPKQKIPVKTGG